MKSFVDILFRKSLKLRDIKHLGCSFLHPQFNPYYSKTLGSKFR